MTSEPTATEYIRHGSGEALAADDLRTVTARDETTVVLLAGPVGCGKTTILVGLYELFNQGPVGGLLFGGSLTLAGFEQICHSGRTTSGGTSAETVRTNPHRGAAFLHLRVADVSGESTKNASLLISDVTGEAFDEARDSSEPTVVTRALWRRADVICVVLDGRKLTAATTREVVRTGARTLLRATHEAGFITKNCRLAIVTTKWDLVTNRETEAFIGETEVLLKDRFGSDFKSVSCHRIAARPTSSRVPFAHGLPELLTDWVWRSPSKLTIARPVLGGGTGPSEFARLFWEREAGFLSEALDAV